MNKLLLLISYLSFAVFPLKAQNILEINKSVEQYKFTLNEIEYLEDSTNSLTFSDIKKSSSTFQKNKSYYPRNNQQGYTYWFRSSVPTERNSVASRE